MDPNSIFFNSVYENYLNLFINNVNMLPVKENLINSLIYIFNSLSKIDVFVFKNNEYISYFLYKLMKTMYNTIIKSKNNMEIYIEFLLNENFKSNFSIFSFSKVNISFFFIIISLISDFGF